MDQVDLNVESIIFDSKRNERPPWKVFGKDIPRSEIVYFTQILIVFAVFIVASINLTLKYDKVDLTSFWTGLLGAAVFTIFPQPKL
ncbi:MAG: hypothetical protein AAF757_18660 [Cyanobacteria bacterium P01_D01_bin.116]